CWPITHPQPPGPGDSRVRVMTYNVKWGRRALGAVLHEIVAVDPDLLLVQDTKEGLDDLLRQLLPDRQVRRAGQQVIARRRALPADLTAPVPSLSCRRLFQAGLSDAFSAAGRGYGYTYGHNLPLGYSYVRLDHIMATSPWQVEDCWAGDERGSDHRPVIADLR